ncbi:MAG: hypothetical protein QF570_06710 [Myxococcota bacterium]|nr:hypothetical protein [Myxococcota bacterium]
MSFPVVSQSEGARARRWDAVIVGSNIPALVLAARLGMAGNRVLVVEEEAARTSFAGLREPFYLAGARGGGVLEHSLKELTLSLLDRRRIEDEEVSYQLVAEQLRADIGRPELTAEELVAWSLCKPDTAHALVRNVHEASEVERKIMLSTPLVRVGRRMSRARTGVEGSHRRGLPAEAAHAEADLARVLKAQVRALSNLATTTPGPEAQARLLGSALSGGVGFPEGGPWLHEMLRRRVESVFGEFRTLSRKFRLVSVMNQPGVSVAGSNEIWAGRLLVVAAPTTAVAGVLEAKDTPEFLKHPRTTRRRINVHLRVHRDVLPEGMAKRVILLPGDPSSDVEQLATLSVFARENDPKHRDVVLRGLAREGEEPETVASELRDRALELMPFHHDKIEDIPVKVPRWDDDHLLEDPLRGACWPGEIDLRASAKLPVHLLDRAFVGGLGLEGDLLLGLRAGEILRRELE